MLIKNLRSTLAILTTTAAPMAGAADINSLQLLSQQQFRLVSEDIGAALSFKPLLPSEAMGVTGFDVGIAITGTKLKNEALLERASSGSDIPGTLPVPTLRAHKGLPLNIDVGLLYSQIPNTNMKYIGGELRWAALPGSALLPAVAIRLSATQLQGVDQWKVATQGLDVSVSKGFAFATPYVGAGIVRVTSTPQGVPLLRAEKFNQSKFFGGVNLNFGLVNLAFEVDTTDSRQSAGVKFGLRF